LAQPVCLLSVKVLFDRLLFTKMVRDHLCSLLFAYDELAGKIVSTDLQQFSFAEEYGDAIKQSL